MRCIARIFMTDQGEFTIKAEGPRPLMLAHILARMIPPVLEQVTESALATPAPVAVPTPQR